MTCCSKETNSIVELLLTGSSLKKSPSGPVSEDLRYRSFTKGELGNQKEKKKNEENNRKKKKKKAKLHELKADYIYFFSNHLEQGYHRHEVLHLLS